MSVALANHLWQSTLFTAAAALFALLLRNESASVRYWLWFSASAKYLLPFAPFTALGRRLAPAAAPERMPVAWSVAMERLAHPVTTPPSSTALALGLAVVWLAGTLAMLSLWLKRAARIRAVVRDSEPCGGPLARMPAALRARYSAAPLEPAVVGIFRPVLLLPRDIAQRLSPPQLQAVLAHELCHLRRRDNLAALVHMVVQSVFWFHPLVWWIGARLMDERERACDEAVVGAGHDPMVYAEGILNVCELYVSSSLACAAGVSGTELKRRVLSIMRNRSMTTLTPGRKLLLLAFGLSVLCAPFVVGWLTSSGGAAFAQESDESLPIVKVAPRYPAEAAAQHLEGSVIVEFTITRTGSVEDVRVVESTSPIFEQAAVEAASKFKYEPKVVNGEPVEVPGVRNKFTFVYPAPSQTRPAPASPQ